MINLADEWMNPAEALGGKFAPSCVWSLMEQSCTPW